MLTNELINNLIGIDEAYKMPDTLMQIVLDPKRKQAIFEEFLQHESDLSFDWFTDYFQSEHGDRTKLKQDYTPDCLTETLAHMAGQHSSFLDLCAGCGGLTIKTWTHNRQAKFYCEEISSRVLPVLLFNLAIRNMDAVILFGDTLKEEYNAVYVLTPGEKFSEISVQDSCNLESIKVGCVISNPPYSLKWQPPKQDYRFNEYGIAPAKAADFAFVLHGMSRLEDNGHALFILPHGVLFRGASEGVIRQELLQRRQIKTVLGLPDKLFLNTQIPVCILETVKNPAPFLFVADAAKEFKKGGKQNTMEKEHLQKVFEAVDNRKDMERFASVVSWEKIEENDFNLNIPRYVDTTIPEKLPEYSEIFAQMVECEKELQKHHAEIIKAFKSLRGFTYDEYKFIDQLGTLWGC